MPSLREFQTRMASQLLGATPDAGAGLFTSALIGVEEGLAIYRANIEAAAANALRLTFPTVDRVVGQAYFNHLCALRVRLDPPRAACLSAYAEGFPRFLASAAQSHGLSYLADVAMFDLALVSVANAEAGPGRRAQLGAAIWLELDPTLQVLRLDFPADEIRSAIDAGEAALAQIDMHPCVRWHALWRDEDGVRARRVSSASGHFLTAIMSGRDLSEALGQASAQSPEAAAEIEQQIIRAPFARILTEANP